MLLFKQLFRELKKLPNPTQSINTENKLKKHVLPLLMSQLSKLLLSLFVNELDMMVLVLPNIVQLMEFVTFSAMTLNIQLAKLFLRLMDASINKDKDCMHIYFVGIRLSYKFGHLLTF